MKRCEACGGRGRVEGARGEVICLMCNNGEVPEPWEVVQTTLSRRISKDQWVMIEQAIRAGAYAANEVPGPDRWTLLGLLDGELPMDAKQKAASAKRANATKAKRRDTRVTQPT